MWLLLGKRRGRDQGRETSREFCIREERSGKGLRYCRDEECSEMRVRNKCCESLGGGALHLVRTRKAKALKQVIDVDTPQISVNQQIGQTSLLSVKNGQLSCICISQN